PLGVIGKRIILRCPPHGNRAEAKSKATGEKFIRNLLAAGLFANHKIRRGQRRLMFGKHPWRSDGYIWKTSEKALSKTGLPIEGSLYGPFKKYERRMIINHNGLRGLEEPFIHILSLALIVK